MVPFHSSQLIGNGKHIQGNLVLRSQHLNLSCHHVVGANKDKESFGLPKCGLLTKRQYCTGLSIHWCLLLNYPSGRKWLLYTVALVALTLGYDNNLDTYWNLFEEEFKPKENKTTSTLDLWIKSKQNSTSLNEWITKVYNMVELCNYPADRDSIKNRII